MFCYSQPAEMEEFKKIKNFPVKKEEVIRLFQVIGQASLELDLQNSHSGNMACRFQDEYGQEYLAITRTGSQKGDLEAEDVCFLAGRGGDYSQASSELEVHRAILNIPGVGASFHAHAKELTIASLAEQEGGYKPESFILVDELGATYLGGSIPIVAVERATASVELGRAISSFLGKFSVAVVLRHGLFSRGLTLIEAFFYASLANHCGRIIRLFRRIGGEIEEWRRDLRERPNTSFFVPPPPYDPQENIRRYFPEEKTVLREFERTGNRLFSSRLSPFHTGSLSLRKEEEIFYAPRASMPRAIGGPLYRLPLTHNPADPEELRWHRLLYEKTDFMAVIRAHIAEAEVVARDFLKSSSAGEAYLVPVDVEGLVLHPRIPILSPLIDEDTFLHYLKKHGVIIVGGGGVWAASASSVSEALHHVSSIRDICLYYLGLKELSAVTAGKELAKEGGEL